MVVGYIDEEDEEGEEVIRDEMNSSSVSNRITRWMRGQQQAHPSVSGLGSISGHDRRSAGRPEASISSHGGARGGDSYASSSVKPSTEATMRVAMIAKAWVSKGLGGGGGGSTTGEGGDTTISSPRRSPKQPLPGIGLHDPLHGRQACPEFIVFDQGVGQICPRSGLFSCRFLPKQGQNCYIPAPPPQSLNGSGRIGKSGVCVPALCSSSAQTTVRSG